ncbi:MAG: hypothetical protein MR830_11120 [Succinatimonas sp.]|nr:hypothetical protein [Succinatimonas sp.]
MYIKDTRKIQDKILKIAFGFVEYNDLDTELLKNIGGGNNTTLEFNSFQAEALEFYHEMNGDDDSEDSWYSLEKAKIETAIEALVKSLQDFDDDASVKLEYDLIKLTNILKADEFNQNPYISNIKIEDITTSTHELVKFALPPLTLFPCDVSVASFGHRALPQIGFFEEKIEIPRLEKINSDNFKQVTPKEINATQKHIDAAHGKVLNIGLGMGYFAYMASLKDNVEKIIIVEQDNELIELFKEHIFPQFSHREKIEIINSTYYDYLKNITDNQFDFCFIDIDEGTTTLQPYLPGFLLFKTICKKFQKMEVSIYLEDEFKFLITDVLFNVVYSNCRKTMDNYGHLPDLEINENDKTAFDFIDYLYRKVKIKDPSDFDYYINYNTLIKML